MEELINELEEIKADLEQLGHEDSSKWVELAMQKLRSQDTELKLFRGALINEDET